MDQYRKTDPLNLNGLFKAEDEKKKKNYKLMVDPAMRQGHQKVYRFDGVLPGDPHPVIVRDPRSRMKRFWRKIEAANLPVPKFKYDQYYVGAILPKEVTFTNLNDNINQNFLKEMCKGFGNIEDVKIYFHPKTKKHLGIGKVMYNSTKSARQCAEKLHQTSKMGNIMNVFVDAMGKERQRLVEEATAEKPKLQPPSPKLPKGPLNKMLSPEFKTPDFRTPYSDHPTPGSSADIGYGTGSLSSNLSDQFGMHPPTPHTPGSAGPRQEFQDGFNQFQPPPPMPPPNMNKMGHNTSGGHDQHMNQGFQYGMPQQNHQGPPPPVHQQMGHHQGQMHYDGHQDGGHLVDRDDYHDYQDSHSQHYHHRGNKGRNRKDSDGWYDHRTSDRDPDRSHGHRHRDRHHGDRHRHRNRDRDSRHYKNDGQDRVHTDRDSINDFEEDNRHHRHRDKRRSRDSLEHNNRDHRHKHRMEDLNYKEEPEQWASPPPPVVQPPKPPSPEPVTEEPVPDKPRFQSLESRIQSLLSQSKDMDMPFGSPSEEGVSGSEDRFGTPHTQDSSEPVPPPLPCAQPPLPEAPLPPEEPVPPPLPPEPAPPPEPMEEKPPLPEEPEPEICDMRGDLHMNSHIRNMRLSRQSAEDDDRMSLSSISSGEEKLEVNAPIPGIQDHIINQNMMYGCQGMWGNMVFPYMNQYQNNYMNNSMSSDDDNMSLEAVQKKALMLFTQADKDQETTFVGVLDQIINELKHIMCKDMQKKMVESSAFKAFESWWDGEVNLAKQSKIPKSDILSPIKEPPGRSAIVSGSVSTVPKSTEPTAIPAVPTPVKEPVAPVKEMSSSLASLFESKEGNNLGGSGFGVGGLLGLRGGIPKMPSFRKKFRPPTPPPEEEEEEEEEDEDEFRGPRTPEESDNEEDKEDDVEPEEDKKSKRRSQVIWSSDSDDEDEDEESEEDEEEDEDEDESAASVGSSDEEDDDEDDEVEDDSDEEDSDEENSDVEDDEDEEESEGEVKVKKPEKVEIAQPPEIKEKEVLPEEITPINREEEKMEVEQAKKSDEVPAKPAEKAKLKPVDDSVKVAPLPPTKEEKDIEKASQPEKVSPVKLDEITKPLEKVEVPAEQIPDKIKADAKTVAVNGEVIKQLLKAPVTPVKEEPKSKAGAGDGLEKDAAMALLQMWNKTPKPSPPKTPESPPRRQLSQAQINMANEHNYFAPMVTPEKKKPAKVVKQETEEVTDSASEGEPELKPCLPPEIACDHNYCQPYFPVEVQPKLQSKPAVPIALKPSQTENFLETPMDIGFDTVEVEVTDTKPKTPAKGRGRGKKQLADVTNLSGSRELANLLPPPMKPQPKFTPRSFKEEVQRTYDFLINGIDQEDAIYLKRRYEELLQDDSPQTYWLNDTHWVDHTHTNIPDPAPPKKRRKHQEEVLAAHKTGCARTEGYYKISFQQKTSYLVNMRGVPEDEREEDVVNREVELAAKKKVQQSREARSESRRWQSVLSSLGEDYGDLIKFNQLKFRKKQLKFARSGIHDWGLFALEPIQEGEMVIEYVGQVVRQTIADLREKKYESVGIGSSYLFRIDHDTIIDATKSGNLARFINHSCNPNCYAKIIPVESHKKIVIYSKRDIDVNEEITYDYKFPLEDEKIACWCGAPNCRGTLN